MPCRNALERQRGAAEVLGTRRTREGGVRRRGRAADSRLRAEDDETHVDKGGVDREGEDDGLLEEEDERAKEGGLHLGRQGRREHRVEVVHRAVDEAGLLGELGGALAEEDRRVGLRAEKAKAPHDERLRGRRRVSSTALSACSRGSRGRQGRTKMVRTQNSQRQLTFSPMKPPTMGPSTGPANGARAKSDMASARSAGENMSLTTPPEMTRGAEPQNPARNRQMRSVSMFLASAQGMLKMAKRRYVMTKTGLRPHCSLNGACVRESASQPRAREPRESEREEVEAHPEERAEREPLRARRRRRRQLGERCARVTGGGRRRTRTKSDRPRVMTTSLTWK